MGRINSNWLRVVALTSLIAALAACSSPSSDQPGATGGAGGNGGGSGGVGGSQCTGSCDDGFSCTIDTCVGGKCTHSIGPNTGTTACPAGQYCTADKGCIASPACANAADCTKVWSGDACKSNIKCDEASSACTFDVLDKDGDKHPPQICGGDDCDDSAPAIHSGSTEACNGKDDDCDGTVDNGASCADALQSCQAGACACKPENLCGTSCVDLATDKMYCGSCDNHCNPYMEECTAGQCECQPSHLCNGECIYLGTIENCSSCGDMCSFSQGCHPVCNSGVCASICP